GIGLWRLHETARETADMMQTPLAKERLVSDWYANVNAGVRRTAAIARSSDPSLVAFFLTTGIGLWRLHETARETADMMQTPLAKERLVSDWYA
ncbi:hypothetical protein CQA20_29200, partial [Klebsiella pneumoniae]